MVIKRLKEFLIDENKKCVGVTSNGIKIKFDNVDMAYEKTKGNLLIEKIFVKKNRQNETQYFVSLNLIILQNIFKNYHVF